ncbi:polysaccharide deacetylase [Roseiarcus fermentans]|uniref:polysaccharide deacetylase n=1 Tax=Roseiarcus fermentans TaxID=1473586 RepID=UPI001AECD537|nr:polysaccharide deacetylase [Roseiarcus fermentans]
MPRFLCLLAALAVLAGLSRAAPAADCAVKAAPSPGGLAAVGDYRPTLQVCSSEDGRRAFAIRTLTVGGERLALLADPEALTTRLERAACWTCRDASEDELAPTRMGRAIAASAGAPGIAHRGFLENAGLVRGAPAGAFVTGDLCPSARPLDRGFFAELETTGPHAPVALSISGLWLERHGADFRWLTDQRDSGRLAILWVNHTFTHPYRRKIPDASNFLLSRRVDPEREILDTERLLIANGETPSLFFRFPGLVSSDPLMQTVRRFHLVTLGADAWLAIGQKPGPGSIVLVHPNGNEPEGLRRFAADVARGAIARPLEPLTAAPQ